MEANVVSLETAKKLKAAGFPQTIAYCWFYTLTPQTLGDWRWHLVVSEEYTLHPLVEGEILVAAPTAQEIADQMPQHLDDVYSLVIEPLFKGGWWAGYIEDAASIGFDAEAPTMAEALALLWLKLHEASLSGNGPAGDTGPLPADRGSETREGK